MGRDDSGVTILELIAALALLATVAVQATRVIQLRIDAHETNETSRYAALAVSLGVGNAETVNCSGWGVFPYPDPGDRDALLYRPECSPPADWVTNSNLDSPHADLGVHVGVYIDQTPDPNSSTSIASIALAGYTDFYDTPSGECSKDEEPHPVRLVTGAARRGGLPSDWSDSLDQFKEEGDEVWETRTTAVNGPPLPPTAGWIVWDLDDTANLSDQAKLQWEHNWDSVWRWRPALENTAMRSILVTGAPPEERELAVQGRRWHLRNGSKCWILAVPDGCVGIPLSSSGKWTWLLAKAGKGIDFNEWLSTVSHAGSLLGDDNFPVSGDADRKKAVKDARDEMKDVQAACGEPAKTGSTDPLGNADTFPYTEATPIDDPIDSIYELCPEPTPAPTTTPATPPPDPPWAVACGSGSDEAEEAATEHIFFSVSGPAGTVQRGASGSPAPPPSSYSIP